MAKVHVKNNKMSFTFRMRGLEKAKRALSPDRFHKFLVESFEAAAKVLQDGIKQTFDSGVPPALLGPSARAAGKSVSQTMVSSGKTRDAVVIRKHKDSQRRISYHVGLPKGLLASRLEMHEFGPTNLPLSDARRNFLRAMGFHISAQKRYIVIPRRPIFAIALRDRKTLRQMENAIIKKLKKVTRG